MHVYTAALAFSLCVFPSIVPAATACTPRLEAASWNAENPPTRELTRVYLARLTLSPEAACAAGVTPEQVTVLFQTASDTLESLTPSIEANDLAVTAARSDLASLRSRAASLLDPGLEPVIHQAEVTLAAAIAAQGLLWQAAFETTIAPLTDAQKSLLRALRANAQVEVSMEFKVVLRTTEEWTSLKKALQHVRSRESCNLAPSAEKASIVAAAASDATVYAAKQRLETSLAAVRTAWSPPELP